MNPLSSLSLTLRGSATKLARGLVYRNKSVESNPQITIPKRIPRGSTDILKAIANTVQRDLTAPDYKYHDDPYLTPTSNLQKRSYAMSQEAGRKAAQWIRQEHADLFQHKVADPPIEAFYPKVIYDENSNVNETDLHKTIDDFSMSDTLTVYKVLQSKGVEISGDTKQKLLEFICFYNEEDLIHEDWIEERWFQSHTKDKRKMVAKTWKDNSLAQQLFQNISPKTSATYSAYIAGMAKHGQLEGACRLYEEAKEAGLNVSIHAINHLISGADVLKESHDLRWAFVEEMFEAIKQNGLSPNLGTLNSALEILSTMATNRNSRTNALQLIAEFRTLGIEPSLASYYHLLNLFCRDRGGVSLILHSILNNLQGKSLTIQHPNDVLFFTTAMEICRFHLSDKDVAFQLDQLLHTADNYNLIGDSYKESVYYRNFFALVCQSVPATEFMEFYSKLVPNIYVPEPGIMEEIINSIDLHGVPQFLPSLWSDIVMFEQTDKEKILTLMLAALRNNPVTDVNLSNKLADVAMGIWDTVQNQNQERSIRKISWTGVMLGNILEVLIRADRMEKCQQVLNLLDKEQSQILGVPDPLSLDLFVDYCIEKKDVSTAIWCIQYCYDVGFSEISAFAKRIISSLKVTEAQINMLVNLAGKDILDAKQEAAVQ